MMTCYDPCAWQVLHPAVSFRHIYLQQMAHEYPMLLVTVELRSGIWPCTTTLGLL